MEIPAHRNALSRPGLAPITSVSRNRIEPSTVALLGSSPRHASASVLLPHPDCSSTSGMLEHVQSHPDGEFIVATENGMLYPLQQAAPQASLIEANRMAFCKYMKMITLPKVRDSLRDLKVEVKVSPETAGSARGFRSSAWSRSADRPHGLTTPISRISSRAAGAVKGLL